MNKTIKYIQNFSNLLSQKGFFHLLSANLLIQLVAFASQLFVAGILSPDDIGRIKIIQTYLSVFSILAGMGFNASTLKLCSEKRPEAEIQSVFKTALIFTLISTISLYVILIFLNYFNLFGKDQLIRYLIPLGLFPIISNSLFMVYVAYFQATMRIKLMSILTSSNKILSIAVIILLTYWFGIKGYYIAYNLSFILMLLVCVKIFQNIFKLKLSKKSIKEYFNLHWKFARSSIFANLLSELSAYVDIILVSYFIKDMNQIGYYSFALTMIVAIRLIPNTVQQITTPYFSAFSNDKIKFLSTFKHYNKIFYLVVLLTFIAFVVITPPLINLIFKGKFDESMHYFYFLAFGWSIRQLAHLQSAAIFGLGKIHYNAYINIISLIFNSILISLSIINFGLIGAAYASIPSGLIFMLSAKYYFLKAYREM